MTELQPADSDIAFCFAVYQEFDLATRLINQLRYYYPESDIICILDGTFSADYISFCNQQRVHCIEGKRLYIQHLTGAWLERLLKTYLERSKANFMVKLDPDSYLKREFNGFPDTDLGGSLLNLQHLPFPLLQGGCRFHTRSSCVKILGSGLLHNPQYKHQAIFKQPRFKPPYLKPTEIYEGLSTISEDRVVSHIASVLDLSVTDWSEVFCRDADQYSPKASHCALIHPVKT